MVTKSAPPVDTAPTIFHIAPKTDWQAARKTGTYRPTSLGRDGFLHCSLAHQLLAVANSVFRGKKGLILLELDQAKVTAEVRHEDLRRSGAPYPHIYGPLNCDAVVATYAFDPGANGTFLWPLGLKKPKVT